MKTNECDVSIAWIIYQRTWLTHEHAQTVSGPPTTRDKMNWRQILTLSLPRYSIGGMRPPKPPASLGGERRPPQTDPPLGRQGAPDRPCAQARIVRTAREQEARMARNMASNHR